MVGIFSSIFVWNLTAIFYNSLRVIANNLFIIIIYLLSLNVSEFFEQFECSPCSYKEEQRNLTKLI